MKALVPMRFEFKGSGGQAIQKVQKVAKSASLPSSSAAKELLDGEPGAVWRVGASTLLRSGLIFPGILLAGVPPKKALWAALFGSIGITSFVILWIGLTEKR